MELRTSEPLEADDTLVVRVGTAVWAVLLVLSLIFVSRLRHDGRLWWVAVCAVGTVLGALGLLVLARRDAARARRAAAPTAARP